MLEGRSILLGVTGSIAAYKAVEVARLLVKAGASVQVIMTERATAFVTPLTFRAVTSRHVITRWDDSAQAEIGHVEHGYRADAALVAPATAQTMARLALGLADDALGATLLSYDGPLVLAPAMETRMWDHPATRQHVETLAARGARFAGPTVGELASGRSGRGRMVDPEAIVRELASVFSPGDLEGRKILVTAGPTWERLDPVRILTNRSTGSMGLALATEALRRGAQVRLVVGPVASPPEPHPRLDLVRIESAEELDREVQARLDDLDGLIATAAVSDFRPAEDRSDKLKRAEPGARTLELVENPDVLERAIATLRARGSAAVVVGFAAETTDVERHAREKRERKGCDFIVANRVGVDRGFGGADTEVLWLGASARDAFGPGSKPAAARFVLDRLALAIRERSGADG